MNKAKTSFKDKYQKIKKMGEGTYGTVYKAKNNITSQIVAIKKIKFIQDDQGIPQSALRQISILKILNHPSIIKLHQILYEWQRTKLYLVLEFIPFNLYDVLREHFPLSPFLIKSYIFQILKSVYYLQTNRIVHRDLKPQNILVTEDGQIKLCDFGLSKNYRIPIGPMTPEIQTLWYRAPQILFGSDSYDPSIDVWAVGCIFGELCSGKPLFQGNCEVDQIFKILQQFGTPTKYEYPQIYEMEYFKPTYPKFKGKKLIVNNIDHQGLDLLKRMLEINPNKRINIKQALNHQFFQQCSDIL